MDHQAKGTLLPQTAQQCATIGVTYHNFGNEVVVILNSESKWFERGVKEAM